MSRVSFCRNCFAFLCVLLVAIGLGAQQERPRGWVPESPGAPRVGDKIADFTLPDQDGQPRRFSDLLATARDGQPGWILLVFYRGYW